MDWNKLMEQYPLHQNDGGGNSNGGGGGGDGLYVKVMTDEQMEVLRRQISVYATICEQLVEMHKSFTTAQHDLTGIRMGNPCCDPSIVYAGNSISARHRWTPTAVQLQLLERIFEEGSGTPSKEKIKDITSKLSKHGQISETNVYNWFQNRRARSKRKPWVGSPNNAEPEVGMAKEKKMKQECSRSHEEESTQRAENVDTQNPETSSKMPCLDTQTSTPNFKSSASLGSLAWNSSTTNG